MRTDNYPLCCGAAVISDFGNTLTSGGRNGPIDAEQLEKELNREMVATKGKAIVSIILNHEQIAVAGDLLFRKGFKPVHTEYYGGHRKELTMYVRQTPKGKRKYLNQEEDR